MQVAIAEALELDLATSFKNCPVSKRALGVMSRWGEVVFASDDPGAPCWGQITQQPTFAEPFFGDNGFYQWQLELKLPTR